MLENIHDFITAALPWVAIATALAVFGVYRNAAEKENNGVGRRFLERKEKGVLRLDRHRVGRAEDVYLEIRF